MKRPVSRLVVQYDHMLMILFTIRFHPFLVNLKLTRIIESQVNTTSHHNYEKN